MKIKLMTAFEAAFSCKKINHSQKSFCCCQTKTADDGDTRSEFVPYIQMMLKRGPMGLPFAEHIAPLVASIWSQSACLFQPYIPFQLEPNHCLTTSYSRDVACKYWLSWCLFTIYSSNYFSFRNNEQEWAERDGFYSELCSILSIDFQ